MFVKISGTPYYALSTWNDWLPSTWLDLLAMTWADIAGPNSSKILANSNPMVRDIVEDRSTADFSILDLTHSYSFQKGQYVEILDSGLETIFTGFIDNVTVRRLSPGGVLEHRIACVDNHYLADKRLIAKAFVSPDTIADAVGWIMTNILNGEGVTTGTITAPTAIEAISYDYVTVSEALDDLAAFAGCTWFIDSDKKLYFVPRTTYSAAWDIVEVGDVLTNVLSESFEVYSTNPEYRNQQYVRGGQAKTDLQTEIKVGDGQTSSWAVGFKLSEEPDVSISTDGGKTWTPKTMGIKGVDTGKDWYWSANDQVIMQDAGAARLAVADQLKIEYYGLYQVIISSADYTEILGRQIIELTTSGINDAVRDNPLITNQDAGIDEANALLAHYAEIGTKVTYSTTVSGLEAGTLQHITSAIHGLDDDFLITQVEKVPVFYEDGDLGNALTMYNIQAVSGPVEDYWTKVFLRLNQGNVGASIANSTSVVLILRSFSGVATGDIWDYIVADGASDSDSSEFPSYEDGDEIKYVSMWASGVEVFRKYRVAQTGDADSGKFVTTFIINSGECNTTWDTVKLYGGDTATDTFGTGDVVYSEADSYTKNSLEALQMVFTTTEV
jgi:hypothetical protein